MLSKLGATPARAGDLPEHLSGLRPVQRNSWDLGNRGTEPTRVEHSYFWPYSWWNDSQSCNCRFTNGQVTFCWAGRQGAKDYEDFSMTGILWPPRLPSAPFWRTVPRSRGSWEAFRLATALEPRPSHHLSWPIWEFRAGFMTNLVYYPFLEAYLISRYHLDYSQALSLSTLYSVDVPLEKRTVPCTPLIPFKGKDRAARWPHVGRWRIPKLWNDELSAHPSPWETCLSCLPHTIKGKKINVPRVHFVEVSDLEVGLFLGGS